MDNNNCIKITAVKGKSLENPETMTTIYHEIFQIVMPITIGDTTFVQALGKNGIKVFNLNYALCVCETDRNSHLEYLTVGGERFVKVNDDKIQKVYDEIGNLISSDEENDVTVVFAGVGPCLQKINKKTNHKSLYSFEGKLVG